MEKIECVLSEAARSKKDEDYENFFRLAHDHEIFFNVLTSDDSPEAAFSVPLVQVNSQLRAILCFVSSRDVNLKKPFGGLPWKKILEMVINIPQADGLVIQGMDSSWIAIDKEKIKCLFGTMA